MPFIDHYFVEEFKKYQTYSNQCDSPRSERAIEIIYPQIVNSKILFENLLDPLVILRYNLEDYLKSRKINTEWLKIFSNHLSELISDANTSRTFLMHLKKLMIKKC